ncbi:hypothetical protein M8J75_000017 [Diaphorina citri]|nr:hypothetical protein M8J75_000017 [Diaphorina citri]
MGIDDKLMSECVAEIRQKELIENEGRSIPSSKIRDYLLLLNDEESSENFLHKNPRFLQRSTVDILVQWCTRVYQFTNYPAMFHSATRQCLYAIYLLDLSERVAKEPHFCIGPFFASLRKPELEDVFQKELTAFRLRLQKSFLDQLVSEVLKLKSDASSDDSSKTEADASGDSSVFSLPFGDVTTSILDPVEVYENLPSPLKKCAMGEDMHLLEKELLKLPLEEANAFMIQLLQAGLVTPVSTDQHEVKSDVKAKSAEYEDLEDDNDELI